MEIPPIFRMHSPAEWGSPPEWMTIHYLLRAEKCPRSAALRYSKYPELWDNNVYPDKPSIAALAGTAVHAAVARIVEQFAKQGCTNIEDPRCATALKEMGGYTKILSGVIADLFKSLEGNPRFEPIRDWSLSVLQRRLPFLREDVQLQIARISWSVRSHADHETNGASEHAVHSTVRRPLQKGSHFEVELRDCELKWRGIVDYIEIGEQSSVIKDFKTGEPSDDHILQIKTYALLWLHDKERNPRGLPPSRLAICYPGGEQLVDFTMTELNDLAELFSSRAAHARASLNASRSPANISPDNCPNCDVRHLCSDYWNGNQRNEAFVSRLLPSRVDDIQMELRSRKGQKTWLAECTISNHFPLKSAVLLRWSSSNLALLECLRPGDRIRLSGAVVTSDDESDCAIVNCAITTDLLILKT